MGQSKGGGYVKKDTLLPQQTNALNQLLGFSGPALQEAMQGFQQFLPGGGGGEIFKQKAMQDYQQQTIPSILNAFSGSKGSSGLNQALASSAANLNTDLATQLAQMQLQAASGLGGLGLGGSQTGLATPGFAYMQRQAPLWQTLLQGGLGAAGQLGGGWAQGGFKFPWSK
jgi:hypothetical protein